MIKSFRHKGLQRLFHTADARGVAPHLIKRLEARLAALDTALDVADLQIQPGWDVHALKGNLAGRWALKVDANNRLTFRMEAGDAFEVDLEDYH